MCLDSQELTELFIPYLSSSELQLARPLFLPAQPVPQVFHPRPPPALHPAPASRKIDPAPQTPTISVITCVQVPSCYCLGFSISFIFSGIHGLHNPVPVMTEHLPSFMCLFGTVVVIPITQCMDEKKKIKQSVSVHSRV